MIKLKNTNQISRIRDASIILAQTLEELKKIAEPGITTEELDKFARANIIKNKAKPSFLGYMGFPASLCTSINEEVIHGIPSKRKLVSGDIIGLDLGVEIQGYFSDAAITVPIGKVSDEVLQLLKVTEECLYLSIEQAIAGNRIHDISKTVFNHAIKYKYGIVRQYCGHGVGLAPHEDPQIPNYISSGPNPRLTPGMVLAIEPMINLGTGDVKLLGDDWTVVTFDKKYSAHFEHTIAIFPDRTEILTKL